MLCLADLIDAFQIESHAQISTLPRLKPRCSYGLTVEIGLIRGLFRFKVARVHVYIRRHAGKESITTYTHSLTEERTFDVLLC